MVFYNPANQTAVMKGDGIYRKESRQWKGKQGKQHR